MRRASVPIHPAEAAFPARLRRVRRAAFVALALAGAGAAFAAARPAPPADEVLAVVDGQPIHRSEVAASAADVLAEIEGRRLAAEANARSQENDALARALDKVVADRLIAAEAKRLGISTAELLAAEVDAKVVPPTDADVQGYWQLNKGRVRTLTFDQAAEQIREFLRTRRQEDAWGDLVRRLRAASAVEIRLRPLRFAVDAPGAPSRGAAGAPVTLVEFSDFECPYCAQLTPVLAQIAATYSDKVRRVFRQFPLAALHPHAEQAAEASLCAAAQGKFWEMHAGMFANPRALATGDLQNLAQEIGLDRAAFDICLGSGTMAAQVRADRGAGAAAGVEGTPAIFVNGRLLAGSVPYETITRLIDEELGAKK